MDLDREALVRSFLTESVEDLERVEQALVTLEQSPDDQASLESTFRAVHTVKGNAFALGFDWLGEFAHVFEDLLDHIKKDRSMIGSDLITLMLTATDALRQMVAAAAAGAQEPLPEQREILESLREGRPLNRSTDAMARRAPTRSGSPGRRREDVDGFIERARTLRVDIARLDRMLDLTGEIAIARGRLRTVLEQTGDEKLIEPFLQTDSLFGDLQELLMKVRMVPLGPIFRQYVRTARDLAVAENKAVRVVIEGEDAEVDTTVVEHLKDPLTHIVRNAIDHGIESPEARRRAGKDACGRLVLRARQEAGSIVIEVEDDGRGLDRGRILARAVDLGLLRSAETASEEDAGRLILEPGFSTREGVTTVSGRGVGLDVVRRNVEVLRGTVTVASEPGRHTLVTIRLPLTLAIIDGFAVQVAGETFILPLDTVAECVDLDASTRVTDDGRGILDLRGTPLPFVRLRSLFDMGASPRPDESVVVLRLGTTRAGLAVDRLLGEIQTVIKPLGTLLVGVAGLAGAAILGTGEVALILDAESVMAEALRKHGRGDWSNGVSVGGERDAAGQTLETH